MKALFRLTILVVVALTLSYGSVFAATWRWVDSDNKVGWFYDIDSISFGIKTNTWGQPIGVDTSRIIFWVKIVFTPEGAAQLATIERNPSLYDLDQVIALRTLSLPEKAYIIHSDTYYNAEGGVIAGSNYSRTEIIIPDSWGELLYRDIIRYATLNKDILTRRALGLPF